VPLGQVAGELLELQLLELQVQQLLEAERQQEQA